MKTFKFLAGLTLILGLFLFLPPTSAQAYELHTSADGIWKYEITDSNAAELQGIDNHRYESTYGSLANITIPSVIDGYKITSVSLFQYGLSASAETVTLPEGITEIKSFFLGYNTLNRLHTINLPASLKVIGNQSLKGFDSLANVNFAQNSQLTTIELLAFSNLKSLTTFDFEQFAHLKSIGNSAFSNTSLKTVSLGDNVSVDYAAFKECYELASVSFGKNAVLEHYVFNKCFKLKDVVFGDGAVLSHSVFLDCKNLSDLNLGNVKSLGTDLTDSAALKKLVIPKSCTKLPDSYSKYSLVPKNVILYVVKNSAAERYAKKAGYKYKYISAGDIKVGKVRSLKVTKKSASSVNVTWKKVTGASGYEVYMKTNSGSYKKAASLKKGSVVNYTKTKLKKNQTYTFKVRAYYSSSGSKVYGSYSSVKKIKLK